METKLNLDVHAILDKEFHVDFKGYSASEVDALLDLVIEDYQVYDQMIAQIFNEIFAILAKRKHEL